MLTQPPEQYHPYPFKCPRCGENYLVQKTSDVYVCLKCRFREDVSEPYTGDWWNWLMILLAIGILLIIFT
jgi:uncharacterized protein (DUF983 family)